MCFVLLSIPMWGVRAAHVFFYHLFQHPYIESACDTLCCGPSALLSCFWIGWPSSGGSLKEFFLPSPYRSFILLRLHHSSSPCKYTTVLTENSQEPGLIPLIFPTHSLQYNPPAIFSQVINLPVIGEMLWHLTIKCHLIYALFMPHLCAKVLQLFIKCPLSCQNMEIECRYSPHSQWNRSVDRSRRGPPVSVATTPHLGGCLDAARSMVTLQEMM